MTFDQFTLTRYQLIFKGCSCLLYNILTENVQQVALIDFVVGKRCLNLNLEVEMCLIEFKALRKQIIIQKSYKNKKMYCTFNQDDRCKKVTYLTIKFRANID